MPLLLFVAWGEGALAQNQPPAAPVIIEPAVDGQVLHPADVHMATATMVDPDPGDAHLCSEFEIWSEAPPEKVWGTECLAGIERVHAHLADGAFVGALAGRSEFDGDTDYRLRVRHFDDSGDAATSASLFAERPFRTSAAGTTLALELDDVVETPAPRWFGPGGTRVFLTPGATLRVESPLAELLLAMLANGSTVPTLVEPGPLAAHAPVRITIQAGSEPFVVGPSRLLLSGSDGVQRTLHLPDLALAPGEGRSFWISTNGSSFVADANETTPDFSELARSVDVPWAARAGFTVEVAARDFQLPVNIAFVPEPGPEADAPLYYVSELHAGIKVVLRDGTVQDYAPALLNFDPLTSFPGAGEQGLVGVAVDPASGDVFASLLYAVPPGANFPHYPLVVRIPSLDGGRTGVLPPIVVLDMAPEAQGQSHQISNLSFGPDGMLYVHVGDGFDTGAARDLRYFRGKILRLHPSGLAPDDNPFYDDTDGISARDYVFAYGFRNPFAGAWRAADGALYTAENGPEIDRFARIDRGEDYGWRGLNDDFLVRALYNWVPPSAPVNLAWIQPATFGGSGFPVELQGRAYVTESGATWASGPNIYGKRISEITLGEDGLLAAGPTPLVEYTGVGKATAAALAAGPDGLYFSDLYKDLDYVTPVDRGANVLRVRFVGEIGFEADVVEGAPPLAVQFTDTSTLPGASAWQWSFGDGATSTAQHPQHVYATPGRYDVRLEVTAAEGTRTLERARYVRVAATRTDLLVSASPLRSRASILAGATLTENADAFVFVDPPERAAQVSFSIDGVFERTESVPPFDLKGTVDPLASPLAVGGLANGEHVVTAEVALAGGGSEVLEAHFVVALPECGPGSRTPELPDAAPCDDGDGCTDEVCNAGLCENRAVDHAAVDASFAVALAEPLCEEAPSVGRRVAQARKRIARAADANGVRGARLYTNALRKLDEVRARSERDDLAPACADDVAAALAALAPRLECLAP